MHIHSFASDGQYTPEEIVNLAEQVGLDGIALTDHDTIDGLDSFMEAGRKSPIITIPGVEISCQGHQDRYHLLGYFIDWKRPILRQRLKYYERARAERIKGMLKKLKQLTGISIEFSEVAEKAGKKLIGKPHLARTLVEKKIVPTINQAFTRYLGHNCPLDRIPKERMSLNEAIKLVHESGGVAVLAHPVYCKKNLNLKRLANLGIEGLEAFYTDHSPEQNKKYFTLARQHGLAITGGSDFHGSVKPDVPLGKIRIATELLKPLQEISRKKGGRFDLYQI